MVLELGPAAATVRRILEETKLNPAEIAAVGIDGISSTPVCLGGGGEVLAPALIWLDRRAIRESTELESRGGEELQRIAANRSDPSNFGSKLIWIRDCYSISARNIFSSGRSFIGYIIRYI